MYSKDGYLQNEIPYENCTEKFCKNNLDSDKLTEQLFNLKKEVHPRRKWGERVNFN